MQGESPQQNLGKVACYASHVEIYKEIVRRNYTNALILEDDVDTEIELL